jgi:hypothetical protein
MITPIGFLNCLELDEWFNLMEDIANNDDYEDDEESDNDD